MIAALPRDAVWIADNGNKALVAQRLLDSRFTSFDFDHPGARFDPAGRAFPIEAPFAVQRQGRPTSVWPPFYPALGVPFLAWLGTPGLAVPAAAGVAITAGLGVLWLAPALGLPWAASGALVLAFATPLFFYGVTIWEHSLAIALALGAWIALARPEPRRIATAGALVALAAALRPEGALLGVATAAAVWIARRRIADVVALALGAAPIAAAVATFHVFAYGHPFGPHVTGTLLAEVGESAAPSASASLLAWLRTALGLATAYGMRGVEAIAFALCGALAFGSGALLVGRPLDRSRIPAHVAIGAALAAWALGLARLLGADDPIAVLARYNGLLVQMPLAGLASIGALVVWRRPELAPIRSGVVASALFLLLAIGFGGATQFSSGIHWGPRVLFLALPGLVAMALAAVHVLRLHWGFGPLVAAGLASSAVAGWLLAEQMGEGARLAARLRAAPESVVVTSHPLLAQQLATSWREKPMLLAKDAATLDAVVAGLRAAGARDFLWLTPPGIVAPLRGARCDSPEAHRGERIRYFDLDVRACRLVP